MSINPVAPILPARLRVAASKRTVENITDFLARHPEYRQTSANKELIRDFLAKAGVVVPSVAKLEQALVELRGILELAEEAIAVRHISLKDSPGPRVQKISIEGI